MDGDYRDHPRACGKHVWPSTLMRSLVGSPPRLRETHLKKMEAEAKARITPAPAGNTPSGPAYMMSSWDHPRACGKHVVTISFFPVSWGSPPRLRETLPLIGENRPQAGITPAPAGNTGALGLPSRYT